MVFQSRFHQIHPLKLAVDIATSAVSTWLLQWHRARLPARHGLGLDVEQTGNLDRLQAGDLPHELELVRLMDAARDEACGHLTVLSLDLGVVEHRLFAARAALAAGRDLHAEALDRALPVA